jgi:hypothetical protein
MAELITVNNGLTTDDAFISINVSLITPNITQLSTQLILNVVKNIIY